MPMIDTSHFACAPAAAACKITPAAATSTCGSDWRAA